MTGNIHWLYPSWLWLLPALVVAAWLGRRASAAETADGSRFVHPMLAMITGLSRAGIIGRPNLYRAWRWLIPACFIAALAQPVHLGAALPQPPQHRDIVLIVDTSVSMMLRDYVANGKRIERMTLLKGVLGRFVAGLHGDRIGVVVYADHPYTLVPLTSDQHLVQAMLSRIRTGMAGRTNAMGDAVALAVKQAGKDPQRRRILILFSDGARPIGDIAPLNAAALAAQEHLKLYTVAIGAGTSGAAEQTSAGLLYDPADRARLQAMAQRTGGRMFWAGDTAALSSAIARIAAAEREPAPTSARHQREPLYQWPLALGLLLLLAAQLTNAVRGDA